MQFFILCTITLVHYVNSQDDSDEKLTALLRTIFTTPPTNVLSSAKPSSSNIPPSSSASTDLGCECVPYHLCNDGKIIDNGNGIFDIRVNNSCSHYLEVCCEAQNKVEERTTPKPLPYTPHSCGTRNAAGIGFRISTHQIIDETQFGEFPWMVALLQQKAEKKDSYTCGASLIHPQVVLTAAHCISDRSRPYKIRAGEWDSQTTNELYPHQDRDVKTVIVHPKYYAGALLYDFALLILDTPVEITETVDVVCLPNKTTVLDNLLCYVTGWGKDKFGNDGRYQNKLKKVELPIVNRSKCEEQLRKTRLGSHFKLHETFICAGGELGKSACKGDGGAPLVCPIAGQENKYFQAGIVAWGIGCGQQNVPGVYAHIGKAIDWINDQMTANNIKK